PRQVFPLVRLLSSWVANTNCCPTSRADGVPPKGQLSCWVLPHKGKALALNLNTNHQSTGWPAEDSGEGAWLEAADRVSGVENRSGEGVCETGCVVQPDKHARAIQDHRRTFMGSPSGPNRLVPIFPPDCYGYAIQSGSNPNVLAS